MSIISRYKSIKIRYKLFLLLFAIVFIVSSLSLTALQISYSIYDEQLIEQSSVILRLYSSKIEGELNKIEDLTFDLLSDQKVQSQLKLVNDPQSSYERVSAIDWLSRQFLASSQTENYITSISFIDLTGHEYAVGLSTLPVDKTRKADIISRANERKGGITWVEPNDKDKCVTAAREIREIGNMSTLAYLIVRIDMSKLIEKNQNFNSRYKSNLIITTGEKTIYSSIENIEPDNLGFLNENKTNEIININKEKYLINKEISYYTDWMYINILPYQTIFEDIETMRDIMLIIYLGIFLAAILSGLKFTGGITKPLVYLSKKMKRVEKGDFNITDINTGFQESSDEIGQLERDFSIMVDKINTLINENYVKQLLIKEIQLQSLQSQINPHFLYNTLASISGLAKLNKQDKIFSMVIALGNLLRSSINNKNVLITIEEEFELLKDYILIQKARYGERLNCQIKVSDDIKKYHIVKLTLQPIVENSIIYGLEVLTGKCIIDIDAYGTSDSINIFIKDNGPGMDEVLLNKLSRGEVSPKGTGVGLKNVNERLKIIFGEEYGLNITSTLKEGTTVNIRIPCIREEGKHV